MYKNEMEYFADITTNKNRVKPVVLYYTSWKNIVVGESDTISTVDHPAKYLNDCPIVYTSTVLSYDDATGEFETRNTLYKPAK